VSYVDYDTSLYTYDESTLDYDGVLDTETPDSTDHVFIGEIQILSEDEAGPSSAHLMLKWSRMGIHFICDDVTDSIRIDVSNDGTNYVTRATLTGPTMQKIQGPWKYIKVTRLVGNGAVVLVGSRDAYI
jgi:hypothetical protein